ncbi:MAG: hypothetical protein RIS58_82 [Actinomycetota bacterium]|jgi:hypothetical protein
MLKRLVMSGVIVALGAFAMVFGEFDDSPGLQGLGLLAIIGVGVVEVRRRR